MNSAKFKIGLLAAVLFTITVAGLFWLAGTPAESVTLLLVFAAGLSMIFLPCTLPLVFVIIPLSLGKGFKRGLGMALAFGAGMTLTLAIYGVIIALLGKWFGMDQVSRGMFIFAGVAAYIFGLSQLKLTRPALSKVWSVPEFVAKRGDILKSFLMGLFLGNAGVGCPNPAFYVMLAFIATTGDPVTGAILGAVHGLGRVTPLLFFVLLAMLGVNSTKWVATKMETIQRAMGWGLLAVGVYIFSTGFFGMWWWENSPIHQGWNTFVANFAPNLAETTAAAQFFNISVTPSTLEMFWPTLPWLVMILFLILPAIWRHFRKITLQNEN